MRRTAACVGQMVAPSGDQRSLAHAATSGASRLRDSDPATATRCTPATNAATTSAAYDKGARDTALYNAWDVQVGAALRRDVAYSHIHQGYPEVLDQVLVSEEFVATSRGSLGDVRRVEVFNDHLFEGRDRSRSDHGFVRALLRLRLPDLPPSGG